MVREFYALMGFKKVSEDEQGNTVWEFDLTGTKKKNNTHIKVDETGG